jgi:hypothetical protein
MIIEISDDKTNIQAKEQMKTARSPFELISKATAGMKPLKEDASVVRAD